MRVGLMVAAAAAAAAVVCAGEASAYTITQGFYSSFMDHASAGAAQIGALNLAPNQYIRSATLSYDAVTYLDSYYTIIPGSPDMTSVSYSGGVGFATYPLPVPLSASNAFSGTAPCSMGECTLSFRLISTLAVPDADLPILAGNAITQIFASGGINYSVTSNGSPAFLQTQYKGIAVQGSIVYDIGAVPESATWAMMLTGMGLIGAVARRKRSGHLPSKVVLRNSG